jgi:hypothetical protein
MDLSEALDNNREKIVNRWVEYTLSTYKSSEFFIRENNAFANPVGGITRLALEKLFVLLAENADPEKFKAPVGEIMRLRSVQEFTPSQAIAPINAVKHIVREVLAENKDNLELVNNLYDFEFAVDLAMLSAFDIYMGCRERLYKVRIKEIKSGSLILTDSQCPSALAKKTTKGSSDTVENK